METELQIGNVRVFVSVEEDAKIDSREVMKIVARCHAEIESCISRTRRIGFGNSDS
jgi:hypothetical protein